MALFCVLGKYKFFNMPFFHKAVKISLNTFPIAIKATISCDNFAISEFEIFFILL